MTTVFTLTALYGTDDGDGDSNLDLRNIFLSSSAVLSAAPGANQVRVTLLPGTASPAGAAIDACWVGRGAGSGSPNYNGNQTQCLFGGSSSVSFAASASGTGTVATTVLTVVSGSGWAIGQVVTGAGITLGSKIISLGTGSGGPGTYNLSASSTVGAAVAITGVTPVVSDWATFAAGETFDNTKDLVVGLHVPNGTSVSLAVASITGVTVVFDIRASTANQTTPAAFGTLLSGVDTPILLIEMQIGGATASPPFIPNPDPNSHVVASARSKVVAVALAAGAVWVPTAPTSPSNTVPAGWYQPLGVALPVAKAQLGSSFVPFNTPQIAPPVPYGWLSIASSPPPITAAQLGYSSVPFNTRQTNTATIDKWQQPLAMPVLAPAPQYGSSFVPFNTAQITITPPWGWLEPLSTAPPVVIAQQGAFFVPFNTPQFFPRPPWGWHQPLPATPPLAQAPQSEPSWTPAPFPTFTFAWQQLLAATPSAYVAPQGNFSLSFNIPPIANTVTGMPWQQPLSITVRSPAAIQSVSFVPFDTVQTVPPPSAVDTHDGVWTKKQLYEFRKRQKQLAREREKLLAEPEIRRKAIRAEIQTAIAPKLPEPEALAAVEQPAVEIIVDQVMVFNEKPVRAEEFSEWERQDEEDIQFIIQHLSKL